MKTKMMTNQESRKGETYARKDSIHNLNQDDSKHSDEIRNFNEKTDELLLQNGLENMEKQAGKLEVLKVD
ncbi:hypothetical protein Tco_0030721 [Tanacetum coccineum]